MITPIRNLIGGIIDLLKWPAAGFSLLIFFPMIAFILTYIGGYLQHPYTFKSFVIAFSVTSLFLFTLKFKTINLLRLFEHEFTHGLFALLTLNWVLGFDFHKDTCSGHVKIKGRMNWLIIIAPYFFPLITFIYTLLVFIYFKIMGELPPGTFIGFGITTAIHLWSMIFEINSFQTDLQRVGFGWAACFLPGANALIYSFLIVFLDQGITGLSRFIEIFKMVMSQYFS